MYRALRRSWIWLGFLFILFHVPVWAATPSKFNPAEYAQPQCPPYYALDTAKGACMADRNVIEKLDVSVCKPPELQFKDGACAPSDKPPVPSCKSLAGYAFTISGVGDDMKCTYERTVAGSAPGDYIGDCFRVMVVPPGSALSPDQHYLVTAQKSVENNNEDRELTLVPATAEMQKWPPLVCESETSGAKHKILASELSEAGATRRGYAFGVLTMPYKYFPSEKSFLVNVPIGAYLGWRHGQIGSGTTFAVAATLSSVKADTVDPSTLDSAGKPTVTGTADVTAMSGAIGVIFDVSKSPSTKAFKAGVFVGQDVVNGAPTIDYRFNRKTWIAIQIGYDFTDSR